MTLVAQLPASHNNNKTSSSMSFTLHKASFGLVTDALTTLQSVVTKAEANPSIASARIIDDMKPFSYQIHIATDTAQRMAARLGGTETKKYEDDLIDFAAMKARIAEVITLLSEVDEMVVNEKAEEDIQFSMGGAQADKEATVKGWMYVQGIAVPTVFFHVVTAYDIARKEGVALGKRTYLIPFALKYLEGQI